MSLYDNYALQNSSAIPKYQGSAIPELEQAANTMQQRYDTGQQQMDLLDQATKTAQAAPVDRPILNQLIQEKKNKLSEFAKRGDLENTWRDTMLEARDFAQRYAPIAANQTAMTKWQAELQKRQEEGKIDPENVQAAILKANDNYTGLKYDPSSGQYSNPFQGGSLMDKVDVPEKINKWLAESKPEVRGGTVKKDINGWYITNGTETKRFTQDEVDRTIKSGLAIDPEVAPWMRQEAALAPYKAGIVKKGASDLKVLSAYQNQPAIMADITDRMRRGGVSAIDAVHQRISEKAMQDMTQGVFDYAHKGIVDERITKHEEEMDPVTVAKAKKALDDDKLIPMNMVAQTGGADVKSVGDFKDVGSKATTDLQALSTDYANWKSAPNRKFDDATGKVMENVNGKWEDVTSVADNYRQRIKEGVSHITDLNNIDKAAQSSAGFDPSRITQATTKKADDAVSKARQEWFDNYYGGSGVMPTPEDLEDLKGKLEKVRSQAILENTPGYDRYEKELTSRLKPNDETSKYWLMPNDKIRKTLESGVTELTSKLGLKDGMLGFNIAHGPNAGEQIKSKDYDDLQGKINPVGITNSSKDGQTNIVFRANQDIQGKKVKGENMLLSVPDAGWVDDYVKKNMSPQDQHYFYMDKSLKSGLNNTSATMRYPIRDANGSEISGITIRRNRGGNSGNGAFVVVVPGPDGPVQIRRDSYEGVTDLIDDIQQRYLKTK